MSELITADTVAEPPQVRPALIQANLLTFGRRLRAAGLPVGSGQIMSMLEATAGLDLRRHEDIYHATKATLVTRPEQIPVFDAQFARFWRELLGARPVPLDPFMPDNIPSEPPLPDVSKKKTEKRQEPSGAEDEKDIFHISEGEDGWRHCKRRASLVGVHYTSTAWHAFASQAATGRHSQAASSRCRELEHQTRCAAKLRTNVWRRGEAEDVGGVLIHHLHV